MPWPPWHGLPTIRSDARCSRLIRPAGAAPEDIALQPEKKRRATLEVEPGQVKKHVERWMASLAELRAPRAAPSPRLPRRPHLRPPRVSGLAASLAARVALRAGIPIEEFLRHRLARSLSALPIPAGRLPVTLSIEDGGFIATSPSAPPQARRAPWHASFLRAEGASALAAEIQLAQADAARFAARIEVQRKRADEVARTLEEASRGAEVADPADPAQAEQMGRPPVPPPFGLGLQLFALALLLAETWQLAVPCLEAAGIRTADVVQEAHRNPLAVALGLLFALGASASLFLFASIALRRLMDLVEAQPASRQTALAALGSLAACAAAAAMAWSIADMRPGGRRPVDLAYARTTVFLVSLAIPATTAWLLRLARRLDEVRDVALAQARAWDQVHYRKLQELGRYAAVAAEEERRCARLEADRALALRRLRILQQRAAAAERLAADAADTEEQELLKVAQAVTAALELDRYEYLRQGRAHGVPRVRAAAPAGDGPPRPDGVPQRNLGLTA
jgi:hypothetical protein